MSLNKYILPAKKYRLSREIIVQQKPNKMEEFQRRTQPTFCTISMEKGHDHKYRQTLIGSCTGYKLNGGIL